MTRSSIVGVCLALGLAGCGKESTPPGGAPTTPTTSGSDVSGQPPTLGTINPASGSGKAQVFTATYSHPGGAKSVVSGWLLVEKSLSGKNACFLEYNSANNRVNLMDDGGSKWLTSMAAGSRGAITNSQCSVDAAGVKATFEGNTLTVTFPVTFTSAFTGPKTTFLLASGPKVGTSWVEKGSWTVQ